MELLAKQQREAGYQISMEDDSLRGVEIERTICGAIQVVNLENASRSFKQHLEKFNTSTG